MKLIPNYTISYNSVFHSAKVPFEISPSDRGMLEKHGIIIEDSPKMDNLFSNIQDTTNIEKPLRRPGRPKKVVKNDCD